jgi:hypothetical protein
MTSLHQCPNQENVHAQEGAVERVIVDRPPTQPLSRRSMSGGPCSDSVKESHKDPGVGDARRRENTFERLQQQSDSKWTSGSGVITDRPPSQPLSRRQMSGEPYAVERLQQSDSRWSSGSRATFDTASSSQALAHHRMLVGPSSLSALEHSVETKNQDIFETTITTLGTLVGVQCTARAA